MSTVHFFASFPHYADHLEPIAAELRRRRVDVQCWAAHRGRWWGDYLHPARRNIDGLWVVAGEPDARSLKTTRPFVYVEHGAGQVYDGDPESAAHPAYSSGQMPNVGLFICPSETVAARRRATHPDARAVAVGCPKLDWLHRATNKPEPRTVALAWHWDCPLVPESRSAWAYYERALVDVLGALDARGWRVVAHAHPRIERRVRPTMARLGVDWWDADLVLLNAAVLVADNTSLLYEFASLDRPVVVLNAPWYRRDVDHGLRFWSHVPGEMVDEPCMLAAAVDRAARDHPAARQRRRTAVEAAYAAIDGSAASRAADHIEALVGRR